MHSGVDSSPVATVEGFGYCGCLGSPHALSATVMVHLFLRGVSISQGNLFIRQTKESGAET